MGDNVLINTNLSVVASPEDIAALPNQAWGLLNLPPAEAVAQAHHLAEKPLVVGLSQPVPLPKNWPLAWLVGVPLPGTATKGSWLGHELDTLAQLTLLRKQALLSPGQLAVLADGQQVADPLHYAELILPYCRKVLWINGEEQAARQVEALLAEL